MSTLLNPLVVITQKGIPYLRENVRLLVQYIFTLFFIGLAIWFVRHEQTELLQVKSLLGRSRWEWVGAGAVLTLAYIVLQGMMYVTSFRSLGIKIALNEALILFLKRNLISVFLPAGGVSSLAFFSSPLERKGISKSQIYFASSIYAFVGILSVVFVAVPAFASTLFRGNMGSGQWMALLTVVGLIGTLYLLYRLLLSQGAVYRLLIRFSPSSEVYLEDLRNNTIERRPLIATLVISVLIEWVGIAHVYIAMRAVGAEPSLFAAVITYSTATVFLIVSPFLRGLGAIEISMTYLLVRFGAEQAAAISVTFLYRFLEFWLPLLIGLFSFLLPINRLLMRVMPAILLLVLGIVNIVSVLTPALADRLHFIKNILPLGAITVSNYFVLIAGLFLLVTAAFMLKGLRTAWYFAVALSLISVVGNLTKAVDYEEALLSLVVLVILFLSRKEYYIKNNPKLGGIGIRTLLLGCAAVVLYGSIGFYFLDKKHFTIDFNWGESVRYTLQNFFLIGSNDLVPRDAFARDFLYSINLSGALCIAFLIYTLVRPYIVKATTGAEDLIWAKEQLRTLGTSSLDYFKAYPDKLIYRSEHGDGFISYRVSGNFAVVLECPVGTRASRAELIRSFDQYCYESGLKSIYYRVSEEDLPLFLGKKKLFLGQEGVVDLSTFSLQGGARSSIRNALKKVNEKGYHTTVYTAPVKDGLLQKLKSVSDEWLMSTERSEIVFSQGMFLWEELKNQTIITVENQEEKIVAFLNIIPDYTPGEGTYDLIRKTADAPNGVIDFITVALFEQLKKEGFQAVNLGFAPLSGIAAPHNFPERSMKFAYEKIHSFAHYKGLRDFKEKFSPVWHNKYLIYDQDYDLLAVPSVLSKVIKP